VAGMSAAIVCVSVVALTCIIEQQALSWLRLEFTTRGVADCDHWRLGKLPA